MSKMVYSIPCEVSASRNAWGKNPVAVFNMDNGNKWKISLSRTGDKELYYVLKVFLSMISKWQRLITFITYLHNSPFLGSHGNDG